MVDLVLDGLDALHYFGECLNYLRSMNDEQKEKLEQIISLINELYESLRR